jgi:hypothetical protein
MLKRMLNGGLTTEDQKRINTSRVIGYKGLKLPSMLEGKYQTFLFNKIIFYLNLKLSLKCL